MEKTLNGLVPMGVIFITIIGVYLLHRFFSRRGGGFVLMKTAFTALIIIGLIYFAGRAAGLG